MSNLLTRTLSSIAFVFLILGPLMLNARTALTIYSVLGALTLREILVLSKTAGSSPVSWMAFILYLLLTFLGYEVLFHGPELVRPITLALCVTLIAGYIAELFRTSKRPLANLGVSLLSPVFVSSSFIGIGYFFAYRDDLPSFWMTASVFALIWINDAGAYLIGRQIGRRKLFERLSPNKTIEGSIGGFIAAMLSAIGLSFIKGMPPIAVIIPFALAVVVAGSLGDLFESRVKRDAGVKDSGKFLPGHGGFFDRFDAMMLAIPTAILFFELFYPKH